MSLDLGRSQNPIYSNQKPLLRPLILVERARNRQESPISPSTMAFPSAGKTVQRTLTRATSHDVLPTPPQTPTLVDSEEQERGRPTAVVQYHLPFRTIRPSLSPDKAPSQEPQKNASSSNTIVGSLPILPDIPPRPSSRMSWCSTATSSTATITAVPKPTSLVSNNRLHRRSQSYSNVRSTSRESRGSNGTFGGGLWSSTQSTLDQESIIEVEEEYVEAPGVNDDDLTPTMAHSLPLKVTEISPLRPKIRTPPRLMIDTTRTESGTVKDQMATFCFPSLPSNPPVSIALPEASIPNPLPTPSTPSRLRVFSLPTCMPSVESLTFISQTSTLDSPGIDTVQSPPISPTPEARPRRLLRKSPSPSLSVRPASTLVTMSLNRPGSSSPAPREMRHRESACTMDTSASIESSKKPRSRKSVAGILNRIFHVRKTSRMKELGE